MVTVPASDRTRFTAGTDMTPATLRQLREKQANGQPVAIRVGRGTRQGYENLYQLLIDKTQQFGKVYVEQMRYFDIENRQAALQWIWTRR